MPEPKLFSMYKTFGEKQQIKWNASSIRMATQPLGRKPQCACASPDFRQASAGFSDLSLWASRCQESRRDRDDWGLGGARADDASGSAEARGGARARRVSGLRKFGEEGLQAAGRCAALEEIPGGRPPLAVRELPACARLRKHRGRLAVQWLASFALVPLRGTASDLSHGIQFAQPPGIALRPPPEEPEPRGGAGRGWGAGTREEVAAPLVRGRGGPCPRHPAVGGVRGFPPDPRVS